MKALLLTLLLTGLDTVEVPSRLGPPAYEPLDLTAVVNADPWDPDAMTVPEIPFLDAPFVFIEGEAVFRADGAAAREMTTASGGAALHGLGTEDEWAEWAFDVPFDSEQALLYARVSRGVSEEEAAGGIPRPFTILAAELNERPGGVLYAVAEEGTEDFEDGIAQADLGRVRMGRHLLRLSVRMPGEPVTIDCLWIAARPLDIRNELDENGRMAWPFSMATLPYRPGRHEAGGIPFELVDPRANEGLGVLVPDETGVMLELNGEVGDALLLLGAGGAARARGVVTVRYADGDEQAFPVEWPPLYTRWAAPEGEITVPVGNLRRATVRRLPLQAKPLASVAMRADDDGRLVLLAATLLLGSAD